MLQVLCLCRFRARTCLRNLASPLAEDTAFAGFTTVRNAETSMTLAHTTSFFCRKNGSSAAASANRASLLTSYLRSRFTFLSRCNNGTYSRFHVYLVNGVGWHGQARACPCRQSDEHGQIPMYIGAHATQRNPSWSCDEAAMPNMLALRQRGGASRRLYSRMPPDATRHSACHGAREELVRRQ